MSVNFLVVILLSSSFARCCPGKNEVKGTWDLSILILTTAYESIIFSKETILKICGFK